MRPSPAITSVEAPIMSSLDTPSIIPGLPAFPIPAILPSLMPISPFTIPHESIITALVMTISRAPSSLETDGDWPMPSLMDFPPPNLHSSPKIEKSSSISTIKPVSASLIRSPFVGPYIAA